MHLKNNQENPLTHKIDIKGGTITTWTNKEFLNKETLNRSRNNNSNRSNVFIQFYEFISLENKPFRMTFTKKFKE